MNPLLHRAQMWCNVLPPDAQALSAGLAERAAREREAGHTIYPPQEQIFRALELTPPEKVKVCLIGQDPHTKCRIPEMGSTPVEWNLG